MTIEITKGDNNPVSEFFSAAPASSRSCCNLRAKRIAQLLNEKEEARLDRERIEEALKELSSIHQWIERNHPDGFIDSLTYFQNLERVTDNWYDRLDRLEVDAKRFVRERDEARHKLELCMAANSDVGRIAKERDEALDQVKELIYIVERAIALAEIDLENDKFGVVSELRKEGVE
jgi:hypothetical protein